MLFFLYFNKIGAYVLIRGLFCLCISPGYDTRRTKNYMHTNRWDPLLHTDTVGHSLIDPYKVRTFSLSAGKFLPYARHQPLNLWRFNPRVLFLLCSRHLSWLSLICFQVIQKEKVKELNLHEVRAPLLFSIIAISNTALLIKFHLSTGQNSLINLAPFKEASAVVLMDLFWFCFNPFSQSVRWRPRTGRVVFWYEMTGFGNVGSGSFLGI